MRILFAEPIPSLGGFLKHEFENERIAVDVVGKGQQAKTAVLRNAYDAVVIDLDLPHEAAYACPKHRADSREDDCVKSRRPTGPLAAAQRTC